MKPDELTLQKKFPEWLQFEQIVKDLSSLGKIHELGYSRDGKYEFPLLGMSFGSTNPDAPCLLLTGGVHGLERIGSQVVLSLMRSFGEMLLWDKVLQHTVTQMRVCFLPVVNPFGILNLTRANANGVDLMRNAPVEDGEKPTFLVGGQRLTPRIPWFRGHRNSQMEVESQAMVDFVKAQCFGSKVSISIDFHSGFGMRDQLWFPYAKTKKPFPHLAQAHAFKEAFDRTYPHHVYLIEPQAHNYTTHGDVWDYSYDEFYHQPNSADRVYLPLCLEMGSWMWVKKNPFQMFSALGPFNPIKPHRKRRILRRHLPMFDFLIRALLAPETWAYLTPEMKAKHQDRALELWYAA